MAKTSSFAVSRHRSSHPEDVAFDNAPKGKYRFHVLVGWLVLIFLLGGSSRPDVGSLQLIRPLSLFILAYGLSTLTADNFRQNRFLLLLAAAWLGLLLLQLIPLPPAIWHAMGGRELVRTIDETTGLNEVWRPLSLVPFATWNAFWASLTPVAVLVLLAGLHDDDVTRLVSLLIILCGASAAVAVLQMIGDPHGPLYIYRYTNFGMPVGLLANRNHQAVLLASAIPMLTAWVALRNARAKVAPRPILRMWYPVIAGAVVLVPLILLTGSRSGLAVTAIALISVAWLAFDNKQAEHAAKPKFGSRRLVISGVLTVFGAIAALVILMERASSVNRLLVLDAADDMRVRILPTAWAMIGEYMPWGSGIGTFNQVYRVHEPDRLLNVFYMNQAHNDWIDIALTGGLPAMILLVILLTGLFRRLPTVLRRQRADNGPTILPRLGFVIVILLGLASITDYPLRVPSMACLGTIALFWITSERLDPSRKDLASANI